MKNSRKYLIISLIIISLSFILFRDRRGYLSEDNILGVYVNNELSANYPSKDSAMFQKAVCDDTSTKVTWDNDNWGLSISNLNKKVKCNLYFYSGQTVFDFDYTGGEQTFIAPVSGTYRLETWGAQGYSNLLMTPKAIGGYGGYSTGIIAMQKKNIIYLNIGGSGNNYINAYNGGGYGQLSGGGATHIARKMGQLSSLENTADNILIVSGGGGGNDTSNDIIPSGGGFRGVNGYNTIAGGQKNKSNSEYNGKFGQGGNSITLDNNDSGGGGGGGYYGGSGTLQAYYSGAGGSGYIGNSLLTNKVMYCYNCEESSEESTKTISTTCSEETPTSYCAKKGNGYARITLVSIDE